MIQEAHALGVSVLASDIEGMAERAHDGADHSHLEARNPHARADVPRGGGGADVAGQAGGADPPVADPDGDRCRHLGLLARSGSVVEPHPDRCDGHRCIGPCPDRADGASVHAGRGPVARVPRFQGANQPSPSLVAPAGRYSQPIQPS